MKKPKKRVRVNSGPTYGDLLVATIGQLDREAPRSAPVDGTPYSIGGRLGELQKVAEGKKI
jgi:hypothetical protein